MIIPGSADCKAFKGKQVRSTKTGKLNRYEYITGNNSKGRDIGSARIKSSLAGLFCDIDYM